MGLFSLAGVEELVRARPGFVLFWVLEQSKLERGVVRGDVVVEYFNRASTPSITFLDWHFRASDRIGISWRDRYIASGSGRYLRSVSGEVSKLVSIA